MKPLVLVTGASGNVGREVLRVLSPSAVEVRRAVRPGATGAAQAPGEAVPLDFYDPATFAPALEGCAAVFLLRPPAIADTRSTLLPFIDAARAAGVGQIVFLSVAGAARNRLVPHHAVERHLQDGPPAWTILRPGFFAQNVGTAYRQDVREDDRLYVPAGRGRVAFVDLRDVGVLAAEALKVPAQHQGQAYTLTGSEAFSFQAVAALLSVTTGRPIRYEPATVLGYARHLRRRGLSPGHVAVQTILHVGLRFGQAEAVDPTLSRLLGRPARTLRD